MANEARVTSGFTIKNGNLERRVPTARFSVDVAGEKGPTPGAIAVSTNNTGVQVDLSQLTTPGLVQITNLSESYYVEWGVYEPATSTFYPVGEVGPGESYCFKFSRNLLEEYVGTGTSAATNQFRLRATGGSCNVDVQAYEA